MPGDRPDIQRGPNRHITGGGLRKPKITPEMIDELVQLVEAGNYLKTACAAVGISEKTLREWRLRGLRVFEWMERNDLELEPDDFPEDVVPEGLQPNDWLAYKVHKRIERAEAKAESYAVLIVRKHMPDQWTAAMTFLERRFPDKWRKRQTTELVDGGQVVEEEMDENRLLENERAVELMHDALEQVATTKPPGQLPAPTAESDG